VLFDPKCIGNIFLYLKRKGRAIVEVDTDGGYVMSETEVEESSKVRMFDKFIDDLKIIINSSK